MTKYIPCNAPGIMLLGAHVSHLPGHLTAADLPDFAAMRDAGIMCGTCHGNGMVAA